MVQLYRLVLSIHVVAGITGLAAFWTPALARKGQRTHVRVGRIFYHATVLIALTGLAIAALIVAAPTPGHPRLLAPFLAYLVLITFAPVHHGVRVLETRGEPARLRTWFHTTVNVAAIIGAFAMVSLAFSVRQPVFAALSPIGVLVGLGNLRFARRPYESPMSWWYEHMGSMLGGGIAFHTAFLVIGAGRLLGTYFTGIYAVIPWVLPALIGIPATHIWVGYYRRKFERRGFGIRDAGSGMRFRDSRIDRFADSGIPD